MVNRAHLFIDAGLEEGSEGCVHQNRVVQLSRGGGNMDGLHLQIDLKKCFQIRGKRDYFFPSLFSLGKPITRPSLKGKPITRPSLKGKQSLLPVSLLWADFFCRIRNVTRDTGTHRYFLWKQYVIFLLNYRGIREISFAESRSFWTNEVWAKFKIHNRFS